MHDLDFETHFYLYVFQICLLSTRVLFYTSRVLFKVSFFKNVFI